MPGRPQQLPEPALMTGESWPPDLLKVLLDERAAAERRFADERDRRYAEVALEREKALKIKEEADKTALGLQRETQTYKDEKANELRSQIERERGSYATQADLKAAIEKIEATIKPLASYVSTQQGRSGGFNAGWGYLVAAVLLVITVATYLAK